MRDGEDMLRQGEQRLLVGNVEGRRGMERGKRGDETRRGTARNNDKETARDGKGRGRRRETTRDGERDGGAPGETARKQRGMAGE